MEWRRIVFLKRGGSGVKPSDVTVGEGNYEVWRKIT